MPEIAHGTRSAYVNGRCRCDACRNAYNAYNREHGLNRRLGQRAISKRKGDYVTCKCGRSMTRHDGVCARCRRARESERKYQRRQRIAVLWNNGRTAREIAAILESTPGSIHHEIYRMRDEGWGLVSRWRTNG